jgi:hypothetical protein
MFMVKLGENEFNTCFQFKYCIIPSRYTRRIQNAESQSKLIFNKTKFQSIGRSDIVYFEEKVWVLNPVLFVTRTYKPWLIVVWSC